MAEENRMQELEQAPVGRLLVKYSLPAVVAMVAYSLYNVIASIYIGHGVGDMALSGLAVAFPVMNLTFALGTLVGLGSAAVCSIRRCCGGPRRRRSENSTRARCGATP